MSKQKNPIFLLFFATLLVSFLLTIQLTPKVFAYFQKSASVPAQILSWQVHKKDENHYYISMRYQYPVSQKIYKGNYARDHLFYPNKEAAIHGIKDLKKRAWTSYYSPSSPERSSLEKRFPYSYLFRWILSLLLAIYFFALFKKGKNLEI